MKNWRVSTVEIFALIFDLKARFQLLLTWLMAPVALYILLGVVFRFKRVKVLVPVVSACLLLPELGYI